MTAHRMPTAVVAALLMVTTVACSESSSPKSSSPASEPPSLPMLLAEVSKHTTALSQIVLQPDKVSAVTDGPEGQQAWNLTNTSVDPIPVEHHGPSVAWKDLDGDILTAELQRIQESCGREEATWSQADFLSATASVLTVYCAGQIPPAPASQTWWNGHPAPEISTLTSLERWQLALDIAADVAPQGSINEIVFDGHTVSVQTTTPTCALRVVLGDDQRPVVWSCSTPTVGPGISQDFKSADELLAKQHEAMDSAGIVSEARTEVRLAPDARHTQIEMTVRQGTRSASEPLTR